MDDMVLLGHWTAAMLRSSTPLLVVTLGETLTQRVGIINLGVEGQMLAGACAGFAIAAVTGDPLLGFVAGAAAGVLLSAVHALLCLACGANQIGSGIAVWTLGLGLTSYFGRPFVGGRVAGLPPISGPAVADVPFLGPVLTQLTPTAPAALLLVVILGLWLYRTSTGLNWRIVGESFETARAIGIAPLLVQLQGILVGGLLSGFAGAILSVDYTQTWANDNQRQRLCSRWFGDRGALESVLRSARRTDFRIERGCDLEATSGRVDIVALPNRLPALRRLFVVRHRSLNARGSHRRNARGARVRFWPPTELSTLRMV